MSFDAGRVDRVEHGGCLEDDLLDFSANVNTEVPEGTREVYLEAFDGCMSYPDDGYPGFRRAAAEAVGCREDRVVPVPGGLAGLRLALSTLVQPGDTVAVPYPSFGEYRREAELQGAEPDMVPYQDVVEVDPSEHAAVVVCDPNNPTGECYSREAVVGLCRRCRDEGSVAVVDEAFLDFTSRGSVAGEPGSVVIRSLTKMYGLPGLRLGFLVARGEALEALESGRRSWNLGAAAAAVGEHVLGCEGFVVETRRRVERERARMRRRLSDEFDVWSSDAPFLLLEHEGDLDVFLEAVREGGVAVRDARSFRGLDGHFRVAVRLPGENDELVSALLDAADE